MLLFFQAIDSLPGELYTSGQIQGWAVPGDQMQRTLDCFSNIQVQEGI